jgi:TIR domain
VAPATQPLPARGSIFLSYASQDRSVVEQLRDVIKNANLDVWFDSERLDTGDDFRRVIHAAIDRCDLFIPVLARRWLDRERRVFRTECDFALRKAAELPPSYRFLFPVVIDDLPPRSEDIDPEIRDLSWYSIAGGLDQADFVDRVRDRYRKNQKA